MTTARRYAQPVDALEWTIPGSFDTVLEWEYVELKGDRYVWRLDPKEVFRRSAEDLYRVLLAKVSTAKKVAALGSDTEYWTQAANVVLRMKNDMLAEQGQ